MISKTERKHPIGAVFENGLSGEKTVEKLIEGNFLDNERNLTDKGREYTQGILENLTNVERIMIEKFILEFHEIHKELGYGK